MIRFIFNFIFFGVLFYAIYHFFPDTFAILTGWTAKIFDVVRDAFSLFFEWIQKTSNEIRNKESVEHTQHAIILLPLIADSIIKSITKK